MNQHETAQKVSAIVEKWGFDPPRTSEHNKTAFVKILVAMEYADRVIDAASDETLHWNEDSVVGNDFLQLIAARKKLKDALEKKLIPRD